MSGSSYVDIAAVKLLNFSFKDESNWSFSQWVFCESSGKVLTLFPFEVNRVLLARDVIPREMEGSYYRGGF